MYSVIILAQFLPKPEQNCRGSGPVQTGGLNSARVCQPTMTALGRCPLYRDIRSLNVFRFLGKG